MTPPPLESLLRETLSLCRRGGASYGEVRWVRERRENLIARDGQPARAEAGEDEGVGIRVIVNGAWGFAATSDLRGRALGRAARRAVALARAAARVKGEPVRLAEEEPASGRYETPFQEDPFEVPLEEKLDLLCGVTEEMRSSPLIQTASAHLAFFRTEKRFLNTEGADITQSILESGGGMECYAVRAGEVQRRSYPAGGMGDYVAGGFEHIRSLYLPAHAERVAREARELLDAPPVSPGRYTVILEGSQLALQLHESCGHAVELDRALGEEVSLAGASFLTPEGRGKLRYGSPLVHITADATLPGGLGTFGFDDEGVPARRVYLVREGIFCGYLSSRETAARLGRGERSSGSVRAAGWGSLPIIRMTNVNLEPGEGTLEELIADTPRGLLLATNKSWSIDDLRLNFHFGCEVAWLIEGGRLTGILKNPVYAGITPGFWASCDAICGGGPPGPPKLPRPPGTPASPKPLSSRLSEELPARGLSGEWRIWGVPNCGKGEPMQLMRVGHGVAPARFREVEVGSG